MKVHLQNSPLHQPSLDRGGLTRTVYGIIVGFPGVKVPIQSAADILACCDERQLDDDHNIELYIMKYNENIESRVTEIVELARSMAGKA